MSDREIHSWLQEFAKIPFPKGSRSRIVCLKTMLPELPIKDRKVLHDLIEQAHSEDKVQDLIANLLELMPEASDNDNNEQLSPSLDVELHTGSSEISSFTHNVDQRITTDGNCTLVIIDQETSN